MAIRKLEGNTDVLTAAKQRIINVWDAFPKVYLSFSGGKDSLCLTSIIYDLIMAGQIDRSKFRVVFIDEEGIYPSMLKNAENWREKFLKIGVPFDWYCLPFKQVCTLETLSAAESWITWEPGQEDVWMRQPPPYAIVQSDLLHYAGEMNYQTFLSKRCSDGISLIGLRTAESYTRLQTVACMDLKRDNQHRFYPIYDWTDNDVWLYIKERGLEFPEIYMHLYEAGVKKPNLRLSAFFGDKTTQGLRWVAETDPNLWERIERRMPNAYLVMLYWDSEMFARNTRKRKAMEEHKEKEAVDYREKCLDLLFRNTASYNINHDTLERLGDWRRLFVRIDGKAKNWHFKKMYESVLYGDPKGRDRRSLIVNVFSDYAKGLDREGGKND